jgi:hypothetical protein
MEIKLKLIADTCPNEMGISVVKIRGEHRPMGRHIVPVLDEQIGIG